MKLSDSQAIDKFFDELKDQFKKFGKSTDSSEVHIVAILNSPGRGTYIGSDKDFENSPNEYKIGVMGKANYLAVQTECGRGFGAEGLNEINGLLGALKNVYKSE